jgi:hypothetical protein
MLTAENETLEYQALTASSRDASRVGLVCWVAGSLVGAVLLSWGVSGKQPALMLPVVIAVACGFYANLRSRYHVRLVAGYLQEYHDQRALWFERLRKIESTPVLFAHDWVSAILANAIVIAAVTTAWLDAGAAAHGELMAGVVTGGAIAFAFHSLSETARLRATNSGAIWHQSSTRLHERVGRAA